MVGPTDTRPRHSLVQLVVSVLALGALIGAGLVGFAPSTAVAQGSAEEQQFWALTNQARASAGLPALQWDDGAANIARAWSQNLANAGTLSHNPNLVAQIDAQVTTDWTRIGENVGYGPSVGSIQNAFLNSPPHTANILGDYNRVGIGTVLDGSGRLWVTLDFINGPPLPPSDPFGSLDAVQRVPGGLSVTGWAADPDAPTQAVTVVVYVDGNGYSLGPASINRPDVNSSFPGYGSAHGYTGVVPAAAGSHRVCAYGLNIGMGNNAELGCQTFTVNTMPFGSLDSMQRVPAGLQLSGWAIDPDSASSIGVAAYVDSTGYSLGTASGSRSDVGSMFPAYGSAHAYIGVVPVTPGVHQVCVFGLNVGPGANNAVGCKSVVVNSSPVGSLDLVQRVPAGLQVAGWALDPDTVSPVTTVVYVDGNGYSFGPASFSRSDVAAFFPGYGANHGYTGVVPVQPGVHQVCAYGLNIGAGQASLLGCRTVVVSGTPFGSLDVAQPASNGITVAGWAIDPDSASPINVVAYADGVGFVVGKAKATRTDVASFFPGYGSSHGYVATLPVGHGTHQVCTYGLNVGAGDNGFLGCATVTN